MQVISSNLNLNASHERKTVGETTVVETESPTPANNQNQAEGLAPNRVSLNPVALRINSENLNSLPALPQDEFSTYAPEGSIAEDSKTRLMRLLLEQFTGRQIPTVALNIHEAEQKAAANESDLQKSQQIQGLQISSEATASAIQTELTVLESISEKSQFSAQGTIQLASGREISINIETSQRSEYTLDISANFQDPLVVQLGTGPLEFIDEKVNFDLTANGEKESVYFVTGNSSFLAVDQNRNGRIDSGAELFGALTGDGYQELAQFDEDGNGFIDGGDSIYQQLLLFNKDANGFDHFTSLEDAGVGAIYLQRVTTPMGLAKQGEMAGQMRASSIYLMEDGGVGKTHQVDLVV